MTETVTYTDDAQFYTMLMLLRRSMERLAIPKRDPFTVQRLSAKEWPEQAHKIHRAMGFDILWEE